MGKVTDLNIELDFLPPFEYRVLIKSLKKGPHFADIEYAELQETHGF